MDWRARSFAGAGLGRLKPAYKHSRYRTAPAQCSPRSNVAHVLSSSNTSDGKVPFNVLHIYPKRADSGFPPNAYGRSVLLNMLKTYDLLTINQEANGTWTTSLAPTAEAI